MMLFWMHCGSRQTRLRTSPTWNSPRVHSGYLNCSPVDISRVGCYKIADRFLIIGLYLKDRLGDRGKDG